MDQPDSEEKTETRTGTGKAGIESTRDIQIVACSAAETTTEIEAGNMAVRETEGTLNAKAQQGIQHSYAKAQQAMHRDEQADYENHVNVATAFRQVLKKPRGIPPKVLAQALQTLEESALQNMQDFRAQQIANTLHIIAKQRYKATGPLLLALQRRAESISGEFNLQEVAKTLWAFATMGTKPEERMMGQLERRAEAISEEFNPQAVANTLVGACDDGDKPGGADDRAAGAAGGGDIRGVQLAGCCKHAVGRLRRWGQNRGSG
jgi:hypothetical protein